MDNRTFFNGIAEKWDTIAIHDASKINRIIDIAEMDEFDNILDVGAGTGVLNLYYL